MNKKILIIEDNPEHYKLILSGAKLTNYNIEVHELNLKKFVSNLKKEKSIVSIPNDIDLFIIDVSLDFNIEPHNELGLELFVELSSKYEKDFDYIITSIWDKSEFQLVNNIDDVNFLNKNNHQGFELELKVKHKLNMIWKK